MAWVGRKKCREVFALISGAPRWKGWKDDRADVSW
jgi:hypothetical protein